jgi:methionyl-tRNA synthetase
MTDVSQFSKLAELRRKTDQELVGLLGDGLELGFHLARVAAETNNAATDSAKSFAQAEDVHAEISKLLHKVDDAIERRHLEKKLNELCDALDRQVACSQA